MGAGGDRRLDNEVKETQSVDESSSVRRKHSSARPKVSSNTPRSRDVGFQPNACTTFRKQRFSGQGLRLAALQRRAQWVRSGMGAQGPALAEVVRLQRGEVVHAVVVQALRRGEPREPHETHQARYILHGLQERQKPVYYRLYAN